MMSYEEVMMVFIEGHVRMALAENDIIIDRDNHAALNMVNVFSGIVWDRIKDCKRAESNEELIKLGAAIKKLIARELGTARQRMKDHDMGMVPGSDLIN
jgi:hypothetical protein